MDNAARLKDLMLRYSLRRCDVAALLGKPLNAAGGYSNSTIDRWLSGIHQVPGHVLELLELKLAKQQMRPDHWQRLIGQPIPYKDQRELERDLGAILDQIAAGNIPLTGKVKNKVALQRAGYWLEIIAHLGGTRFQPHRARLLAEAERLHERIDASVPAEPLRAGEQVKSRTLDDLARKWHLTRGADIQRFRQLAQAGRV